MQLLNNSISNTEGARKKSVESLLVQSAFFNLFIVALLGIFMRSFPFFSSVPLAYKNVLHGHSHFAFGGWILPILIALIMKGFPELTERIAFKHWRNITFIVLLSAYGMLISFPVQGYKGISVTFSTLSIAGAVYLTIVIWRAIAYATKQTSHQFLKWGLAYSTLSSIGPFATVPLIIMGKQGSPLYFDLIYFYLHFQYNGFFTFTVLAIVYQWLQKKGSDSIGKKAFFFFNLSCLPAYALSVLWHQPSVLFNFTGGIAGILQVAGFIYLLKDLRHKKPNLSFLLKLSIAALGLKVLLQLISAIPGIAILAYQARNFVIAYLHLVLLGFVSLFAFGVFLGESQNRKWMLIGISLFFFSFVTTETILVVHAIASRMNLAIPFYAELLLFFSLFFVAGSGIMAISVEKPLVDMKRFRKGLLTSG